jgi:hypothetical protein
MARVIDSISATFCERWRVCRSTISHALADISGVGSRLSTPTAN